MDATIMQLAYINGLYNALDTPFSKRVTPKSAWQASTLIDELKEALDDVKNEGGGFRG